MNQILEEVKNLQGQGLSEEQIVKTLRDKNYTHKDILDALSQSKIKEAIEQPQTDPNQQTPQPSQENYPEYETSLPEIQEYNPNYSENSISNQHPTNYPEPPQQTPYPEENYQQNYASNNQAYDPSYDSYQPSNFNSDIVSEISEQVFAEKISEIRKGIEKMIDFKTTTEAHLESLSDRLKRLEKIIDTLNSAVLRKVGNYVTDVQDLKKELIETQKTFTKLLPKRKTHHSKNKNSKK